MEVRQRILNSTAPFSGSSKAELKGSFPECSSSTDTTDVEAKERGCKAIVPCLNPLFSKLLSHGTAEQVGEKPLKTSTFIAQAECETQDSQEFSPSCLKRSYVPSPNCFTISSPSEHNNVACPIPANDQELSTELPQVVTPQKKTRKRQKRKLRKKTVRKNREQAQRRRQPSGVPEQESGRFLEVSSDSSRGEISTSYCSSIESSEEKTHGLLPTIIYNRRSSCSPIGWRGPSFCAPSSVHSFENDSDSLSSVGDCSLALAGLRGSVSQGDRCYAGPFFQKVASEAREGSEELWSSGSTCNEGIIFYNEKLSVVDSEYKVGCEFVLSKLIKGGSYGDVHCAKDLNTGFDFAVKKIAMSRFISEEVGAWSAVRSPHVLELFGVVREGANIFLLMDRKAGSLGQLITQRGRLPEDLSLHYMGQVLTALEYLVKKRVAHLDIKADNVLLSEDGKNSFLCDFGHAERLDNKGMSLSGLKDLKGTESHMAPEVVKEEPRGAKADVWSSCCMLLHMLNGCQPWTRYYTCRLFLKIADDPPPLQEIPAACSHLTAELITAGLQKDPVERASAAEMKVKAARALKEVGGVTSPVRGAYMPPLSINTKPPDSQQHTGSSELNQGVQQLLRKLKELDVEDDPETDRKQSKKGTRGDLLDTVFEPVPSVTTVPELELRKLERDFCLSSLSQLHSAEQLLSCLTSDHYSSREPWDKKDSGRWSLCPGDNFSSGVCSYNSQPDGPEFSVDLLGQAQKPFCLEGVDISITDFNRTTILIRETRRVKVGHVASGISDQISERVFTLKTQHGQEVAHDEEVQESGLKLCCVPAPDCANWRWRIRDGVLETR
ncbi:mitogen-activated protein kinase kinase kinase 14 [Synchiropus splendidus]|uniref:mitogen-activated protein kinase kinase kinase 14 n=1 Tax=Synchiropus splendidus TaxID=270530 RepID=UPI00237E7800|nr:mitogen-activated protein kinase kinase kinase 14 [Synchiropus splendidus]